MRVTASLLKSAALPLTIRYAIRTEFANNVLGTTNNSVVVLDIAASIEPVAVEALMLRRDFPVMFLLTVLLFFMAYGIHGPGKISRNSGGLLLAIFFSYQVLVWVTATRVVPG